MNAAHIPNAPSQVIKACHCIRTALAILMICAVPPALAQVVPTAPQATTFKFGEFKISILRDGALEFPNDGSVFATNASSAAVSKVLKDAGAPTDKIRLAVDVVLIRMRDRLVMLDAGYGPAANGIVRRSLALAAASPDDVTDILITHSHPDHVGGLVDAQGRPAFPKAAIWMSAKEWAFMQTEDGVRAEVPVIRAQVKTFQPGRPLMPGITPIALPGHTPGHVGYEIVSEGYRLMDIGDAAHSSIVSLARPGWTLAWDSDKQEAAETRRHELQRLADTHELMFAPHFPFPGIGRIRRVGDGFRFRPRASLDE